MGMFLGTWLIGLVLVMSLCGQSIAQTCSDSFSSNRVFSNCNALSVLNSFLHWNYHQENNTVDIAFRKSGASTSNWISWGINPSAQQMSGTQALVAYQTGSTPVVYTTQLTPSPNMQNETLTFDVSNLSAEMSGTYMIIYATLHLNANLLSTNQIWQEGPMSGSTPSIHSTSGDNMRSMGTVNFQTGTTTAGSGGNSRMRRRNTHGVISAVSWGVLMPMGVMIARYLKVFKVANPAWFYLHAACQTSAYIVGVAGFATGIKLGKDSAGVTQDTHRTLGIIIFCFGTLQLFALLLRPKPDHKYRIYWNIYHHSIGYATIALSIANIFEGFDILDPEKKWKRAYIGILIFLGAVSVVLEALTWFIVLNRKKTESSDKHANGTNGVNGYAARTHHDV